MNTRFRNIFFLLPFCLFLALQDSSLLAQSGQQWLANRVNVVLHPESSNILLTQSPWSNQPRLAQRLQSIGVVGIQKRFPFAQSSTPNLRALPTLKTNDLKIDQDNSNVRSKIDLQQVYQITLDGSKTEMEALNILIASKAFLLVELEPIDQTFGPPAVMPNDSLIQVYDLWWIDKLEMPKAWNITTGDTQVVTAIIDSGTDFLHLDLRDNLAYNYNDPIDGLDNDNDGFTDNFRGWDFVGPTVPPDALPDNDPRNPRDAHGTKMAGLAAATTNNRIGIPSPGYRCRFVPLKTSAESEPGSLIAAYDAIIYAANKGYQVINCSFGNNFYSVVRQAVVDYAINKNCLIVAAAGNSGNDTLFYPASYDGVFSVASTERDDTKSPTSTYSYAVDICAPGAEIVSTNLNQDYWVDKMGYTSVSSAIASGAAALVRSHFPNYSPLQIAELLRVTADDVVPTTRLTNYKLGKGRLNVHKALTTTSPSVRVTSYKYPINATQDTLSIRLSLTNYLVSCQNLKVNIRINNPFVQPIATETVANQINTLQTVDLNHRFTFKLASNTPHDLTLDLIVEFQAGNYTDWQVIPILIKQTFANLTANQIATTITSIGGFGFANPLDNTVGLGFKFKGSLSWLFEGSFLLGNSIARVSDNMRSPKIGNAPEDDFRIVEPIQLVESTPNLTAFRAVFEDWNAEKLGVKIDFHAKAYTDSFRSNVVELQYNIKNTGTQPLENLIASLFEDWDMLLYNQCQAQYDASRQMILIYYNNNFVGVKIHNESQPRGSILDIINDLDLSTIGKFRQMRDTLQIGQIVGPTDIAQFLGTAPFSLNPAAEKRVQFSLIAGNDLATVQRSADAIQRFIDCSGQVLRLQIEGTTSGCTTIEPSSIWFKVSGGTPPYRFMSNNELIDTIAWKRTAVGNQTITVEDDYGCKAETTVQLPVSSPLRIHSIFTSKETCDACQTGFVVVNVKGGSEPYTYSLNGQTQFTGRFGGLSKGNYTLTITDVQGCTLDRDVMVE
jgi:serine protease